MTPWSPKIFRSWTWRPLVRPPPAVERMALSSRHFTVPRRRRRHRPYPFLERDRARLQRPRNSGLPLHGRGGRRHRHPLRAVLHIRHAGALRRRGRRPGRSPRLPAGQPRRHRRRCRSARRARARRRGRKSGRAVLRGACARRTRILDEIEMRRVIEKFRTYGNQDATDPGLAFGGADIPGAIVKGS